MFTERARGQRRRAVSLTWNGGRDVRYTTWIVATALLSLAACGGATSPDGGGGGGVVGGPVGQVTVGDIFFRSARNGSQNPAVDTIVAGSSVHVDLERRGVAQHPIDRRAPGDLQEQRGLGRGEPNLFGDVPQSGNVPIPVYGPRVGHDRKDRGS